MNDFAKILLFSLVVIISFSSAFGQKQTIKVFSPDNALVSKNIIQKREITKYIDGGAFRCGFYSYKGDCDYEKVRKIIWQCWTEKTLCYLTITWLGVDASRTEHIFIEPNKNNQWLVVRRDKRSHAVLQLKKTIYDLPKAYSVEWSTDKNERILLFKNKFGKVIQEF